MPIITTNVDAPAEHGVMGDAWMLPPHCPRQKAPGPDASGTTMAAFSVPDTSNRASPSSFAGTTCRRDRSRISHSAHPSTIRCRAHRSGVVSTLSRPPLHQLRLIATQPCPESSPNGRHEALATCCQIVAEAVPRTSCRGRKGIPLTYRVSPQQLPKVHFVAKPAGPLINPETSSPMSSTTSSTISTG